MVVFNQGSSVNYCEGIEMVTIGNLEKHNKEKALEALIHGLCYCFDVSDSTVIYRESDSKLLKFLLEGGYVKKDVINRNVHDRLLTLSEEMYRRHIQMKVFPDHLGSEAVFGYGLRHKRFPAKDIVFDHGEIAGEYIVASDGLLDSVVEQLFSYKNPEPRIWPAGSDTPSLCC